MRNKKQWARYGPMIKLLSPITSEDKINKKHHTTHAKTTPFSSNPEISLASMSTLRLNSYGLAPFQAPTTKSLRPSTHVISSSPTKLKIRAISTAPESTSEAKEPEEPPCVHLAFVHSVLLPDGTPDVHFRNAPGGQKLRDIMLDTNIELYGPYSRALLNCGGGGTCATCMVEVIEGKELLSPRTDNEKEKLKKKPRNWRLACQTTVGNPDSRGLVVIQQLPEWKAHEWNYEKLLPSEMLSEIQSD